MAVEFSLLGPFAVGCDGVDLTPSSVRGQALLATLAVRAGTSVPADILVEELWPDLAPERGRRVLQVRVSEIRKQFAGRDDVSVESTGRAYRLDVEAEALDCARFERLVTTARTLAGSQDVAAASSSLREALGLWRGRALSGIQVSRFLEVAAAELEESRLVAIEERVVAEMTEGCHERVVGELEALVADQPYRERFWELLILALYRSGRQTEALRAAASVRRLLVDNIGVSPGGGLVELEAAVLAHHPGLALTPDPGSVVVRQEARETTVDPSLVDSDDPRRRVGAPPVQYVRSPDGVNIAFQVTGEGPDLLLVPGFTSHLDVWWEPWGGRVAERLSEFVRLTIFDKRGMGLSDRPATVGIDGWLEDVELVRAASGARRPIIFGNSAGGTVAIRYAAQHADDVLALVLVGCRAKYVRSADYPYGLQPDEVDPVLKRVERTWGMGAYFDTACPSAASNAWLRSEFQRYERLSASPAAGAAFLRAVLEMDVRDSLAGVTVPTLVVHASGDRSDPVEQARYMAERLPNATMVELESDDHLIWLCDARDQIVDAIRTFVVGLTDGPSAGMRNDELLHR